jgi:oxalate decarboxylase/phosphoglucose isomerase-like protein (cupin superfamily)
MPAPNLNLTSTYLRLRSDASVETLPVDDTFWPKIMAGELGDFHNEFLVTMHSHDADWPNWEMHPNGDEIVCLISGAASFLLETPSGVNTVELKKSGDYVMVPKGTWHTAKISTLSTLIFLTPGEGTEHRTA